jgi:hypothetical protein
MDEMPKPACSSVCRYHPGIFEREFIIAPRRSVFDSTKYQIQGGSLLRAIGNRTLNDIANFAPLIIGDVLARSTNDMAGLTRFRR